MNLIEAIQGVPDYRQARGIRHRLWIILTIVLLGSCTGYWGYKPLAEFTKNHRLSLIKLLDLSPDIQFPRLINIQKYHDVYCRKTTCKITIGCVQTKI
ncbi:transposase family protein [Nostoc sp.]|uniref:transposase family protein n=1 Tax=Nostoc sp. TaxID=1180 RepID=UPI003FA5E726